MQVRNFFALASIDSKNHSTLRTLSTDPASEAVFAKAEIITANSRKASSVLAALSRARAKYQLPFRTAPGDGFAEANDAALRADALDETPELSAFVAAFPRKIISSGLKICIVTNELAEFHQNGGLGTSTSGLIHALGARGFKPTVLYTAKLELDSGRTKESIAKLR